MSDLGKIKFKLKLPKFPKMPKGMPIPMPPGVVVPFPTQKMALPKLPGIGRKKRAMRAVAPTEAIPVAPMVAAPSYTAMQYSTAAPSMPMTIPADTSVSPSAMPTDTGPSMAPPQSADTYTSPSMYAEEMPQQYQMYEGQQVVPAETSLVSTYPVPAESADNPSYWESEAGSMAGLGQEGDSWYSDIIPQLTKAYTDIQKAKAMAKSQATMPVIAPRPAPTTGAFGLSLNTILMLGALGLGGGLLFMTLKKRRR